MYTYIFVFYAICLFFFNVLSFCRRKYMKSTKTVTNWTTGKVLAPHSCLPPTDSITRDKDASILHAHQPAAQSEPGCHGMLLYKMSFSFFLYEMRFSKGSGWECHKPKAGRGFSNVVLAEPRWHRHALYHRIPPTRPSSLDIDFLNVTRWESARISHNVKCLLNVVNVPELCSLTFPLCFPLTEMSV